MVPSGDHAGSLTSTKRPRRDDDDGGETADPLKVRAIE